MPSINRLSDILDTTYDIAAYENLVRVLRSGRSLALVGAGFSQRVGYPSWDKLLEAMIDRLVSDGDEHRSRGVHAPQRLASSLRRHEDFLWRAEELRVKLTERVYEEFLNKTFAPSTQADPCLDMLMRMPFRHVLTTNYDNSLEEAYRRTHDGRDIPVVVWDDGDDVRQLMYELLQPDGQRKLVYLHGKIGKRLGEEGSEKPSDKINVILSDRDYAARYLRTDSTVRKLFAIFAMQRLVLFGFSLRDPDLSAIVRQVAGALGYEGNTRHFAFVGLDVGDGDTPGEDRDVERRRFNQKYGVDAIFYDASHRHARMQVLMEHMLKVCGGGEHATRPILESAVVGGPAAVPPAQAAPAPASAFDEVMVPDEVSAVVAERAIAPEKRKTRMNPRNPDDPRKGMFGGRVVDSERGRRIRATVAPAGTSTSLFAVHIEVMTDDGFPPLDGDVTFFLHPTFQPSEVSVAATGGSAALDLIAYGAFTVGALTPDGMQLELDLSTLDAPTRFLAS